MQPTKSVTFGCYFNSSSQEKESSEKLRIETSQKRDGKTEQTASKTLASKSSSSQSSSRWNNTTQFHCKNHRACWRKSRNETSSCCVFKYDDLCAIFEEKHCYFFTGKTKTFVNVSNRGEILTDDLNKLKGIENLKELYCKKCRYLTADNILGFSTLQELHTLDISENEKIGDDVFTYLSFFPKLRSLDISSTSITGDGFKLFAHKSLETLTMKKLSFYYLRISTQGRRQFASTQKIGYF